MSTSVIFSPSAEGDLDDIWFTVALENPAAADRLIDAIGARIKRLAIFPELGPARPDISHSMRVLTERSYLILYRIDNDCVEIVRVVHGARDLTTLF